MYLCCTVLYNLYHGNNGWIEYFGGRLVSFIIIRIKKIMKYKRLMNKLYCVSPLAVQHSAQFFLRTGVVCTE